MSEEPGPTMTVGRFGSTFVTGCYSWRVPPGARFVRLVVRGGREVRVPRWIARRVDPAAMDSVSWE